jgi:hypothetical protein
MYTSMTTAAEPFIRHSTDRSLNPRPTTLEMSKPTNNCTETRPITLPMKTHPRSPIPRPRSIAIPGAQPLHKNVARIPPQRHASGLTLNHADNGLTGPAPRLLNVHLPPGCVQAVAQAVPSAAKPFVPARKRRCHGVGRGVLRDARELDRKKKKTEDP